MTEQTVQSDAWMDYSSNAVPPSYHCRKCSRSGVKLWRKKVPSQADRVRNHDTLRCIDCIAAEHEGVDATSVTPEGLVLNRRSNLKTRMVAGMVPAIPVSHAGGYWPYPIRSPRVDDWWYRLPVR
jgi:hypothetical protein